MRLIPYTTMEEMSAEVKHQIQDRPFKINWSNSFKKPELHWVKMQTKWTRLSRIFDQKRCTANSSLKRQFSAKGNQKWEELSRVAVTIIESNYCLCYQISPFASKVHLHITRTLIRLPLFLMYHSDSHISMPSEKLSSLKDLHEATLGWMTEWLDCCKLDSSRYIKRREQPA